MHRLFWAQAASSNDRLAPVAPWLGCLCIVASLVACGSEASPDSQPDAGNVDTAPQTQLSGPSEAGNYHVTISLDPTKPPVATYFNLHTEVFAADMSTPATVTEVIVDGWMPQHKHGMEGITPKTSISSDKVGVIDTEGLFFNMPGQWQMRVRIKAGVKGEDIAYLPFYVAP